MKRLDKYCTRGHAFLIIAYLLCFIFAVNIVIITHNWFSIPWGAIAALYAFLVWANLNGRGLTGKRIWGNISLIADEVTVDNCEITGEINIFSSSPTIKNSKVTSRNNKTAISLSSPVVTGNITGNIVFVGTGIAKNEENDKEQIEPLLTYPGTVVGWRVWYIALNEFKDSQDGAIRLRSLVYHDVWPGRKKIEFNCPHGHTSPTKDCMCGIWAFKNVEQTKHITNHPDNRSQCIVGEISIWGRVLEFTQGYRGEFAYPLRLFTPPGHEELARELHRVYEVPVFVQQQKIA